MIIETDELIKTKSREEIAEYVIYRQSLDRAECEESYFHFFKQAWKVLEPETPLVDNWHIKYICDILQAEVERIARNENKTKDIIINVPPRSAKSYLVTIMLTPWIWTKYPHFKVINSSFSMELSTKHCLDSRRLIESEWYKTYWGSKFSLTTDMNTKSWYENNKRGMRKSTSTGAQITGTGGDIVIIDDAQDPEKAESEVERETVQRHYGKTLYSRLNNQKTGLRVIIQQRLHEEDLTGHLLANAPEQYRFICIPAELQENVSPPELRERYIDNLFFPDRFPKEILETAKLPTNLGAYGYSGQMLQSPAPPEGGLFKRYWWKFWIPKGMKVNPVRFKDESGKYRESTIVELPDKFDKIIDSWDLAFGGEKENDDVVGVKIAKKGANKYFLEEEIDKMDYPATRKSVRKLYHSNKGTSNIIIEKAANGPAIKADLDNEIPGIITIPTGRLSKEDRVKMSDTVPYTAQCEAGNCYLPHPEVKPWVDGFIEEHANFPKVSQDGQVDAASQGVNYLTTAKHIWYNFSKDTTVPLEIKWKEAGKRPTLHFATMYQHKDLSLWVLQMLWDDVAGKLFVYHNWMYENPVPTVIAMEIIKRMKLKQFRHERVICNERMFAKEGHIQSVAQVMRNEIRKTQVRVNISEDIRYDQTGAIFAGTQMFAKNEIYIDESCSEPARQFAGWIIDKGKPSEEDCGYCICLCMVISELKRRRLLEKKKKVRDYKDAYPKKYWDEER